VPLRQPVQVVRREDFDADLVEQARALDIAVTEGEGLAASALDRTTGQMVATTGDGTFAARVLVGADGAGSVVRRHLLSGDTARAAALRLSRLEIAAPGEFPARHDLRLHALRRRAARLRLALPGAGRPRERGHHARPAAARWRPSASTGCWRTRLARHGVTLPRAARAAAWPLAYPRAPAARAAPACAAATPRG
jgi:2-polyprenyl-6-methoxyphenol hydroxylase-like FAD-dependent oxidoreductase